MNLTSEKWRWIPGYKNYYKVSTRGRVKSVDRIVGERSLKGKISKLTKDKKGYYTVTIYKQGHGKQFRIHQLVLLAFVGKCPEGMECRHFPDQTRTNNHIENLSYAPRQINCDDRVANGTYFKRGGPGNHVRGSKHHLSKLTEGKVKRIRRLYSRGKYTQKQLASKFGVTESAIWFIVNNKTWVIK